MASNPLSTPCVSVVIPLYNHERFIRQAIESVVCQDVDSEIVIVDDGSSDSGVQIAQAALKGFTRSKIIRQPNMGAHNAINRGITEASGEIIALLNSDDEFLPGKLERALQMAPKSSNFLVFGEVNLINESGALIEEGIPVDWLNRAKSGLKKHGSLQLALLDENFAVTTSNFIFNKRLWKDIGGFLNLRYCHDLEFLMSAFKAGEVIYDSEYRHINYRIHSSNTIAEASLRLKAEIAGVHAFTLVNRIQADAERSVKIGCEFAQVLNFKNMTDVGLGALFLAAKVSDPIEFYNWLESLISTSAAVEAK